MAAGTSPALIIAGHVPCSPASNEGVPYLHPGDEMQVERFSFCVGQRFLGAATFVVVVALLVKLLWH
jgi:hypothetical protein